ncbi:MAG: VC0807 family protein [Lentimonas sp.]
MSDPQPSSTPNPENSSPVPEQPRKQENIFLNLGCNLFVPIMILKKGEKWFGGFLEPIFENIAVGVLLIAIAFPVGYFIYDFIKRSKCNLVSIIGLISVLLTGLFGVLELPVEWFAFKEASLPLIIGIGVIASNYTKNSFCKAILLNRDICNVDKVTSSIQENKCNERFEKLIVVCNWIIAASMVISAAINYILARMIVVSPTGTQAFNDEVSKMMWVTFLAVLIPSMGLMIYAFFKLFAGIKQMTGLELEDVLHGTESKEA